MLSVPMFLNNVHPAQIGFVTCRYLMYGGGRSVGMHRAMEFSKACGSVTFRIPSPVPGLGLALCGRLDWWDAEAISAIH